MPGFRSIAATRFRASNIVERTAARPNGIRRTDYGNYAGRKRFSDGTGSGRGHLRRTIALTFFFELFLSGRPASEAGRMEALALGFDLQSNLLGCRGSIEIANHPQAALLLQRSFQQKPSLRSVPHFQVRLKARVVYSDNWHNAESSQGSP